MSGGVALADPPIGESAEGGGRPDPAAVAGLIRQLDDPAFKKRQEAAAALTALGPAVLPQLEQAGTGASFEAQASLRQITHILRDLLRGVVVYRVVPDSQAARAGLKPGDVIVRVQGQAVTDCDGFFQQTFLDDNDPWRLMIRSGGELREITLAPERRIGVYLADYDERYGPPLIDAIQSFERDRMDRAREGFRKAHRAGLAFTGRDQLLPMYALATYFAGDPPAARALLDEWAGDWHSSALWNTLESTLAGLHDNGTHLGLHVARQRLRIQPDNRSLTLDYAGRLAALGRQPESILMVLDVLQREPSGLDAYGEVLSRLTLLAGLEALDLTPEAADTIAWLARTEVRPATWRQVASTAHRLGRLDLAADLLHAVADTARRSGRFEPEASADALRYGLIAGREAEILTAIQELRPEQCAQLLARTAPAHFRWAKARAVMGELARMAMQSEEASDLAVARAFDALLRDQEPDPAELRALFDRYVQIQRRAGPDPSPRLLDDTDLAFVAVLDGDFVEAGRKMDAAIKGGASAFVAEAVRFVIGRADNLSGPMARWRRTRAAWPMPAGGRLLLTHDDRLGLASADGASIREVPAPERSWCTPPGVPVIFLSPGQNRPLTISNDALYALKLDGTGWDLVARMPPGYGRNLLELGPAFDELIQAAAAPGAPTAVVVWPPAIQTRGQALFSMMLVDGGWLTCDLVEGKVHWPRAVAEQALGRATEIYEVLPVGGGRDRALLCTSQGLLDWRPASGQIQRLALPDRDRPLPVTTSTEGIAPPAGFIRVALLPGDGGTTYLVNTADNTVRREGCVNESCPPTFWKQQPAAVKRDLLAKAIREAGLKHPWPAGQRAE
jgi:hypothetical protein